MEKIHNFFLFECNGLYFCNYFISYEFMGLSKFIFSIFCNGMECELEHGYGSLILLGCKRMVNVLLVQLGHELLENEPLEHELLERGPLEREPLHGLREHECKLIPHEQVLAVEDGRHSMLENAEWLLVLVVRPVNVRLGDGILK